MNKKWECYIVENEEVETIAKKYQISNLLASILIHRNIQNDEEVQTFLHPSVEYFHDPFLMPDMDKAVDRILKAIGNQEKIMIYGDYDVDGITSITVLKKFLEERGANVSEYIPNRLDEGYGLNEEAVREIANGKYDVMITVDCGITGNKEIAIAKELGIETIVTDHHEVAEEIPEAVAVVDAKRKDSKYPFNQLAGCGVVFKLIQAIAKTLELEEEVYLKYLDIVCVGTISDIVPLVDENRVIAKLGLDRIQKTQNIGLKVLLNSIGFKRIDSNTISFGVAPRINACGRMGHQEEALKLFLTQDVSEATVISEKLNEYNAGRQEKEKKMYDEVIEMIENTQEKNQSCIVLGSEGWHHGIIGIVASKVTDLYFKPSILVCFEDGEGKGSGRSIPGFDLHEALSKTSQNLEKFGGHSMAIGLTVKQDRFEDFKQDFESYAHSSGVSDIIPIIKIDKEVTLNDISMEAVEELKLLEPFGEANKMPLFLYRGLKVNSIRALSEGKHLKLGLRDENFLIDAIGFNMGNLSSDYQIGDKVDVVGTLEINNFNGYCNVQINLRDIRPAVDGI